MAEPPSGNQAFKIVTRLDQSGLDDAPEDPAESDLSADDHIRRVLLYAHSVVRAGRR